MIHVDDFIDSAGIRSKSNETDALIDQAFSNGAGAGFNCDTHEQLAKIRESRSGYLAELKREKRD